MNAENLVFVKCLASGHLTNLTKAGQAGTKQVMVEIAEKNNSVVRADLDDPSIQVHAVYFCVCRMNR
jgi:hypothetical protein